MNLNKKKPFVLRFWHIVVFCLALLTCTSGIYDIKHRFIDNDINVDVEYIVVELFSTVDKNGKLHYYMVGKNPEGVKETIQLSYNTFNNVEPSDGVVFVENNYTLNRFLLNWALGSFVALIVFGIYVFLYMLLNSIQKSCDADD